MPARRFFAQNPRPGYAQPTHSPAVSQHSSDPSHCSPSYYHEGQRISFPKQTGIGFAHGTRRHDSSTAATMRTTPLAYSTSNSSATLGPLTPPKFSPHANAQPLQSAMRPTPRAFPPLQADTPPPPPPPTGQNFAPATSSPPAPQIAAALTTPVLLSVPPVWTRQAPPPASTSPQTSAP
ncbi:hypothetical protein BD626DRAFT_631936, partial [Schizophyllum amplum]